MGPPEHGEGRPPAVHQGNGLDASSATITDARVADDLPADRASACGCEHEAAAYETGRLDGFADGWSQGLTAGLERSAA